MSEPMRIRSRPLRGVAWEVRRALVLVALALVTGVMLGPPGPSAAPAAPGPAASAAPAPLLVLGVSELSWASVRELAAGDDPQLAADAATVLQYAAANAPVNLVQRTIGENTCPADGWVTLGAGMRARADVSHTGPGAACSGGSWAEATRLAQADGYGTEPGALATALDAAGVGYAAVGDGAVLALTNAAGPPEAAEPGVLPAPAGGGTENAGERASASTTAEPDLILVDLMSTAGSPGGAGATDAESASSTAPPGPARAVHALAQALRELTAPARVVVVSVADPQDPSPQLAVLPAGTTSPRGSDGTLLVGPTTHRRGLIQLTDLAPTLLAAVAGQDAVAASGLTGGVLALPASGSSGASAPSTSAADPASAADLGAVDALADDAIHAVASNRAVIPMTLALLAATGAVLVAVGVGLRHPQSGRLGRLGWAACWASALPAGIWLSNLLPWWRAGAWAPMAAAVTATAAAGVLTGAAALLALAPRLGRPGAALLLTASGPVVLLVDAAAGAPLGFNGPLGMNAVVAGRFYGVSNTAFALAAGALLVAVAAGADRFATAHTRRRAAVAVAVGVPGAIALAVDGAPQLGADVGGALTLLPALVALGAGLAGVRLGLRRWLGVGLVTVGVVGAFAVADYAAGSRTHLGGFVSQVVDGRAGATLARKAAALTAPFLTSPLALLALVIGVGVASAATWWLRRTVRDARAGVGAYAWLVAATPAWPGPTLRGLAVLVVLEVLVNDSGLTMLLFSAAAALPALAALLLSSRVGPR
ncbi:hypothetical protein GZ998_04295 [Actinomyces sp. 594]|uniref:hypothetical protein n=1 Tax=Actinomyces sp. 594 TaxID=2057793 RepID=UPI001C56D551|nr:hypothetical protein [Actinomyces sp. 594]MBW3068735.1 hypothetical protein [Actinomyces sp. 594]